MSTFCRTFQTESGRTVHTIKNINTSDKGNYTGTVTGILGRLGIDLEQN